MAQRSVNTIKEFDFPHSLMQLRSFPGVCNLYMRFTKDFANIGTLLSDLARTDAQLD